ncbi:hypothetical protein KHQ06_28275 [Nocardia tengchongensis]|uniref:Secreted protein n=1 Tax=Nocardia tengchongensis TaxID=2055889 RepID=A0ABX8CJG9_9NOCA|nr:hypothetical protein [Nocardia tengchongensis]QVI20119.1 hypothetical protein KHQ06_28275 [Nocardia tengchongensis]
MILWVPMSMTMMATVTVQASTVDAITASQAATASRGAAPEALMRRSTRGASTVTANP